MTVSTASAAGHSGGQFFAFNRTGLLSFTWLALGMVIVALLPPQLTEGKPLWAVHVSRATLALLLAAPLFATLLADRQRNGSGVRWIPALAIAAAAYVPALLEVLLVAHGFPLSYLLVSMLVGLLVVLVPLLVGPRHVGKAVVITGILAAALLGTGLGFKNTSGWTLNAMTARAEGAETVVQTVPTALHTLRVSSYRRYIDAKVAGGGIAALGGGYLAASGEGALFYVLRVANGGEFSATPLTLAVPVNREEFFSQTQQTTTSFAENHKVDLAPTWFRVTDLLVEEADGLATVFAVHNYWNPAGKCLVLRVSMLSAPTAELVGNRSTAGWQTLYESTPCMPLTNENQGGRLVRLPDGALLLSVGVHDESNYASAQDPASHYGKTILIDPAARQGVVFTSGHRNPQGLLVAQDGAIWLTEHGPRGGDELNRLVRGANFGWPIVSYGVPYYPGPIPASGSTGSHDGFVAPTYAWVPSIGISNLVEITGGQFPHWEHDLVIASLVRTTLWRARIVDQRVAYVEEIKLDERIRDIIVDPAGRLVLWTDKHSVVFVESLESAGTDSLDEASLTALTIAKCKACHLTEGTAHGIGPNLRGLLGREVAGASGYAYSEALRSAGGTWNEARLEKFLADPQEFAPGVKVEMQAVPDADDRRRAIEWLRSSKP